jgi:hypothetical protein
MCCCCCCCCCVCVLMGGNGWALGWASPFFFSPDNMAMAAASISHRSREAQQHTEKNSVTLPPMRERMCTYGPQPWTPSHHPHTHTPPQKPRTPTQTGSHRGRAGSGAAAAGGGGGGGGGRGGPLPLSLLSSHHSTTTGTTTMAELFESYEEEFRGVAGDAQRKLSEALTYESNPEKRRALLRQAEPQVQQLESLVRVCMGA